MTAHEVSGVLQNPQGLRVVRGQQNTVWNSHRVKLVTLAEAGFGQQFLGYHDPQGGPNFANFHGSDHNDFLSTHPPASPAIARRWVSTARSQTMSFQSPASW